MPFGLPDAYTRALNRQRREKDAFFLRFGGGLAGKETYRAGRYLDVAFREGDSTLVLDFNEAYNPSCAYSDAYRCPIPPAENTLACAIRAGERSFHEEVLEEVK